MTLLQIQCTEALAAADLGVIARGPSAPSRILNELITQGMTSSHAGGKQQIGMVVLNDRGRKAAELAREWLTQQGRAAA